MDIHQFEGRKRDHIRHSLDPANQAQGLSGLDRVRLHHEALPDLDFSQVSVASSCLGKPSPTPFYVSGMTAGHGDAPALNLTLARACAETGWVLGVGSQRRELEDSASASEAVDQWKTIRREVPSVALIANIGASQIMEAPISGLKRLVESLEAQALAVHTNALQEVMQPEGTPSFRGALPALSRVCRELGYPVVLKETGCGFSKGTLQNLRELGLAAIDVAGLGGTHWGRIEGARAATGSSADHRMRAAAAATFAQWGESTVDSVIAARAVLGPQAEIWASGGVRSGLDAAKLIALGARRVGYAKPALEAALKGVDALVEWMRQQEFELRAALFCMGCKDLETLRERACELCSVRG